MEHFDPIVLLRLVVLTALKVGGPILLGITVVGLIVSVMQALTQVQEQSLSFVPKLVVAASALLICGRWMLASMVQLLRSLLASLGGGGIP